MSMQISPIGGPASAAYTGALKQVAQPTSGDFAKALGDVLGQLQGLQARSDDLATQLANGAPVDLHEVVIASEETSLAFQLATQVRNKAVEAYQEIMRMQV